MFSLIAAIVAYRRQQAPAARVASAVQPGRTVANDRSTAFARAA